MKIQWHRFMLLFILNSILLGAFSLIYCHIAGMPIILKLAWPKLSMVTALLISFACLLIIFITMSQYFTIYRDEMKLKNWLKLIKTRDMVSKVYQPHFSSFYITGEVIKDIADISSILQKQQQLLSQKQLWQGGTDALTSEQIISEERHRIAREIHDSVSQDLFALTMLLGTMKMLSPEDEQYQKIFSQVNKLSMQAQNELRALLLHLRPIALANRTLAEGIEHLFMELKSKVNVAFETQLSEVNLPANVEDHLFRIVQELLSNALRHANATAIRCELSKEKNQVVLNFADDGQGFDVEAVKKNSGYGLKNIAERIDDMAGHMQIISQVGLGTQIRLCVPILSSGDDMDDNSRTNH